MGRGLRHYDGVLRGMREVGLRASVTLFHWDTPFGLFEEYGGWVDGRVVEDFFQYAKFVIERYVLFLCFCFLFLF